MTSRVFSFAGLRAKRYWDGRGLYRVFNDAEYRFYRDNSAPPEEGDTPFATSASLPNEPTDTFADGTWYLSVSYFNGVLDSGLLPLGDEGQTYVTLVLDSGVHTGSPPKAPDTWQIEQEATGVVRIRAVLFDASSDAAGEWALAYTVDGSTPAADAPDVTVDVTFPTAVLEYTLPAQSGGTTVKARLQTRRNDGTVGVPDWVYSTGSTVETLIVATTGPTAPVGGERWTGPIPEDA